MAHGPAPLLARNVVACESNGEGAIKAIRKERRRPNPAIRGGNSRCLMNDRSSQAASAPQGTALLSSILQCGPEIFPKPVSCPNLANVMGRARVRIFKDVLPIDIVLEIVHSVDIPRPYATVRSVIDVK